jgi:hypothetical protein
MVFTDGAHLVAHNLEQLHEFARKIGLKPEWFQYHDKHPHYDLTTPRMAKKAVINGAGSMTPRTIVRAFQLGIFQTELKYE